MHTELGRDDQVFKALADRTRRDLLDLLRERNGQTLGELCERVAMTRQSVTQHLAVLEAANLISTVRRGREKLHYLNPVPIGEIQERWIEKFDRPRLRALSDLKYRAENVMPTPSCLYVTYIKSDQETVWNALMDPALTAEYWGHANVSDWNIGSKWEHQRIADGVADVVGTVVEKIPPQRLIMTWATPDNPDATSKVTFDLEAGEGMVRLTVTHEDLADEEERGAVLGGWSAVLSNLKSLLETGAVLPTPPWSMPG